jgi:hypothetical protein
MYSSSLSRTVIAQGARKFRDVTVPALPLPMVFLFRTETRGSGSPSKRVAKANAIRLRPGHDR